MSENVGLAAQHDRFGFVAPPAPKRAKVPVVNDLPAVATVKPTPVKRSLARRVLRRLGVARRVKPTMPAESGKFVTTKKIAAPASALKTANVSNKGAAVAAMTSHVTVDIKKELIKMVALAKVSNGTAMQSIIEGIKTRKVLTKNQKALVAGAESFLTYSNGETETILELVWWDKPFPGNFGDWLSPLVMQQLSGHSVRFVPPNGRCKKPHLISIGSIARFVNAKSVVVGSGISRLDTELDINANYISVRGPITATALQEAGGPVVTRFGDPGLLLSRIFPVTRGAGNGRVALVRHYIHRKLYLDLPETMDELSILLSAPDDIKNFVQALNQYDSVITSAMHIYITCHSYGIPCALVTFEGGEGLVHGDGIKYIDYARGAGVPETPPTVIARDLKAVDIKSITTNYKVSEAKLDEITAAVHDGITAYLK